MNMVKHTILPIATALVAAMLISSIWYSPMLFGRPWIALRSEWLHVQPNAYVAPWKPLVEVMREIVVAYVLTHLIAQLKITRLANAAALGFLVWLGFPVSMLVGASLWDDKPWTLSFIHAGDWLIKMLVMSIIITATRRLTFASKQSLSESAKLTEKNSISKLFP